MRPTELIQTLFDLKPQKDNETDNQICLHQVPIIIENRTSLNLI